MTSIKRCSAQLAAVLIAALMIVSVNRAWATASVPNASRTTYNVVTGSPALFKLAASNVPVHVMMAGIASQSQGIAFMDAIYTTTSTSPSMIFAGVDYWGTVLHGAVTADMLQASGAYSTNGASSFGVGIWISSSKQTAPIPDSIELTSSFNAPVPIVVTQIW